MKLSKILYALWALIVIVFMVLGVHIIVYAVLGTVNAKHVMCASLELVLASYVWMAANYVELKESIEEELG